MDRSETQAEARRTGAFPGLVATAFLACFAPGLTAQEEPDGRGAQTVREAPARVDVTPEARDDQIAGRLEGILRTTGWFSDPSVRVQDGVVFLQGSVRSPDQRKWAGDLARNTQDVTAVVNRIEVTRPDLWDFAPAAAGMRDLWNAVLRRLPAAVFALSILALAWWAARLARRVANRILRRRLAHPLLQDVAARAVGLAVFLAGIYLVFQVAGLSAVALTVMGGTGLVGVILGIAFRDITENLLASILLSLQNPFRNGDMIEIAGVTGYVQRLTIRTTVLMTVDGNHVQIPNATVYKSVIRNFTSNPNRREDFTVGIGYGDSVAAAQETALQVLAGHPAVLKDPEPMVLVDHLGSATVGLRVYFWLDGNRHSWQKVKSSVIRLVKRAFQDAGISMPDEARELIFPQGVPVRMLREESRPPEREAPVPARPPAAGESREVATHAEAGLRSEAGEIREQARRSRSPEEGENLLKPG